MADHDQKISDSKFVGKWNRSEEGNAKQDLEITGEGKIDTRATMATATSFSENKIGIKFD